MHIFLDQIGCRLNYSEMETLAQRLRDAGHRIVASPEDAQVIIFNSCAVTTGAERDSRKRVAALHRANGAAPIAVTGCLATLAPAQTAQLPGERLHFAVVEAAADLVKEDAHCGLVPFL